MKLFSTECVRNHKRFIEKLQNINGLRGYNYVSNNAVFAIN